VKKEPKYLFLTLGQLKLLHFFLIGGITETSLDHPRFSK